MHFFCHSFCDSGQEIDITVCIYSRCWDIYLKINKGNVCLKTQVMPYLIGIIEYTNKTVNLILLLFFIPICYSKIQNMKIHFSTQCIFKPVIAAVSSLNLWGCRQAHPLFRSVRCKLPHCFTLQPRCWATQHTSCTGRLQALSRPDEPLLCDCTGMTHPFDTLSRAQSALALSGFLYYYSFIFVFL